jgi:hypothetical protein
LGGEQKKRLVGGIRSSYIKQECPRLKFMPLALLSYQTLLFVVDDNTYLANVSINFGVNQCND